ncbi:MAG: phosphoribosylformylglycinamidine cyclo-ligase, partial [Alphaproteobacteria bacterium]|nr:phosphoribosylformylglycinamidine cyclo-ligase [Alphaproteobacteria bacterium]
EMLRTFNSGIGMVVVVAPEHAQPITELLTRAGEKVYAIGALKARRHSAVEIGGI